jgi:DNA (cytosine-5)-methyltransferase 1
MKVLNLYAGIGGNRKLWENVEVTAIERDVKIAQIYKENNPDDEIEICDAHYILRTQAHKFDFVWSSPPCQSHSRMVKATRHELRLYPDLKLYEEIIFLQHFFKGKWVVENVSPYYKPLIKPTTIIGRHLFWANFEIPFKRFGNHTNFIKADSPEEIESIKKWLGINYTGNVYYETNHSPGQILRNCVHPEIGLYILDCARGKYEPKQQILL